MDTGKYAYDILYDGNADLPSGFDAEHGTDSIFMTYFLKEKEYIDDRDENRLRALYSELRAGAVITTVQVNLQRYIDFFEKHLSAGRDALYVCFSSGLSGSFDVARMAARELEEKYPDNRVVVVDSRSASMGMGLLVTWAVMKRDEGLSLDALAEWIESRRDEFVHLFTVDDLMFLHRGGRVSRTSAVVGSLVGIKPVLNTDREGHLIPFEKVRGRAASLNRMYKLMGELKLPGDQPVYISHGDSPEDAERLAGMIRDGYGMKSITVGYIGTVIGCHSGPGTVALFFRGKYRGGKDPAPANPPASLD